MLPKTSPLSFHSWNDQNVTNEPFKLSFVEQLECYQTNPLRFHLWNDQNVTRNKPFKFHSWNDQNVTKNEPFKFSFMERPECYKKRALSIFICETTRTLPNESFKSSFVEQPEHYQTSRLSVHLFIAYLS